MARNGGTSLKSAGQVGGLVPGMAKEVVVLGVMEGGVGRGLCVSKPTAFRTVAGLVVVVVAMTVIWSTDAHNLSLWVAEFIEQQDGPTSQY